jgi:hypothetical protein
MRIDARVSKCVVSAAVCVAIAGAVPATASTPDTFVAEARSLHHGLQWTPAKTIVTDTRIGSPEPDVVVTDARRAVAVWTAHKTRFGADQLYAAVRRTGFKQWGSPTRLTSMSRVFDFEVAVSGRDSVTVAYEGFAGGGAAVATRTLSESGWSRPSRVARWGAHSVVDDLDLGSSDTGSQVVAWRRGASLVVSHRPTTDAAWGGPTTLGKNASSAAAFVDRLGRTYIVASAERGRSSTGLLFRRSDGGQWAERRFAKAKDGRQVEVTSAAMNARGDLVVAWERALRPGPFSCPCAAAVRARPAGRGFEATERLEKSGDARPQAAMASHGVATVLWGHQTPTRTGLRISRLDRQGLHSILRQSGPRRHCCDLPRPIEAEVNAHNSAFLVYADRRFARNPTTTQVVVIRCTVHAFCGPVRYMPDPRLSDVALATEPRGGATVVWQDNCVYDPVIEECEYRTVRTRRLATR